MLLRENRDREPDALVSLVKMLGVLSRAIYEIEETDEHKRGKLHENTRGSQVLPFLGFAPREGPKGNQL